MIPARLLPVGDSAVSVELGEALDPAIGARVRALDRALAAAPFPGFREAVPSFRALLVHYDPCVSSFGEVSAALARLPWQDAGAGPGTLHVVPTLYGGEAGPDLAAVARERGLSEPEVIALHSGREYVALMLGFMPGFAYLGLLPERLETPRLATPRPRVPAGSVAIAGRQTAVYPAASPGGWRLLGRSDLDLFDPWRDPPALILPGDRVRFAPVRELPETARAPRAGPGRAEGQIEVLEGGLLTTVQDGGRFGLRRLGVGWAGPMDVAAHRAAQRAAGNQPGAAGLECTVTGPTLRFLATRRFSIAGADLGPVLHRSDLGAWKVPVATSVLARAGNILAFTGRRGGCRAYIAFAGGIDVPEVLGSLSTDLVAGFGGLDGRALRAGDRLALGPDRGEPPPATEPLPQPPFTTVAVRVVLGPQGDHLTPESLARFLSEEYVLGATSDRVGCRLEGPRLEHRGPAEIVSDGMVPGSIQVPPDGRPIVMMADSPTTGGYPKLGTVVGADLPGLAQLLPGAGRVRFAAVTVEEAQRAARAHRSG